MGVPSACILMHELVKLLHYAGAHDVVLFRMGTSGGLGGSGEFISLQHCLLYFTFFIIGIMLLQICHPIDIHNHLLLVIKVEFK